MTRSSFIHLLIRLAMAVLPIQLSGADETLLLSPATRGWFHKENYILTSYDLQRDTVIPLSGDPQDESLNSDCRANIVSRSNPYRVPVHTQEVNCTGDITFANSRTRSISEPRCRPVWYYRWVWECNLPYDREGHRKCWRRILRIPVACELFTNRVELGNFLF